MGSTQLIFVIVMFLHLTSSYFTDNWTLVWSDEFNDISINATKWRHEVNCNPQNEELQCYTDRKQNSYLSNGKLVINVIPETYNNKGFTSARLKTSCDPDGSWKRGRFEIRATLPRAKHLWPAFWLLPTDKEYGEWPRSGSIDVVEYRGEETSVVSSALHYGFPHSVTNTGGMMFDDNDFSKGFHIFALEWEEDMMRWYVDDQNTFAVPMNNHWGSIYSEPGQPWDQRFHIILNVAVGGNFFEGYPPLTQEDVAAWEKSTMEIDYVRVYQDKTRMEQHTTQSSGIPSYCKTQNLSWAIWVSAGSAFAAILLVATTVTIVYFKKRKSRSNQNIEKVNLTGDA